jgi:hypothetical protein
MEENKIKNQEKKEINEINEKEEEEIKVIKQKNIVTTQYPAYVSEYPIDQLIQFLHR